MSAKFVIKKDKGGQFRFNLKAGNGEIIATSEAYTTKAGCKNGIESVKKNAPAADIVDESDE
ncbi:MAG: YegP family protein [Eubacteriales bacterium]